MKEDPLTYAQLQTLAESLRKEVSELFLEYDEQAIQIFVSPKGRPKQRIGYVPRAKNEILSRLMDAGKFLYGIIQEKHPHTDGQFDLTIRIFMED